VRAFDPERLGWGEERLFEVLEELGHRAGLCRGTGTVGQAVVPGKDDPGDWLERAATTLGIEAEPVEVPYADLETFARGGAPLLVRWQSESGGALYLAVLSAGRRRARLLAPDGRLETVALEELVDFLRGRVEEGFDLPLLRLLDGLHLPPARYRRARRAMLSRMLDAVPLTGCWILRPPPEAPFLLQLRRANLPRRLALGLGVHGIYYAAWIGSWALIGRGALEGGVEPGWLLAWVLLLFTQVLAGLWAFDLQGRVVIDFGLLLKRRLLAGALRLPLDDLRKRGSGEMLGRVVESETFEGLALSGGFLALTGLVEVGLIVPVLASGAGGWPHAIAFLAWLVLAVLWATDYFHRLERFTHRRLHLTLDLVERMVGYRTRLVQQAAEHWHRGEDESLREYQEVSRAMDGRISWLSAFLPRAWLVLGTALLLPALAAGTTTVALAVALGGNLLAYGTLVKVGGGLVALFAARVAWKQVAPIHAAATEVGEVGDLASGAASTGGAEGQLLLVAENLTFQHLPERPLLRGVSLRLRRGDRVLLEGPSGSGKSTLLSLLAGLRRPRSGLLLLDGLDRPTLGDTLWRRRLAVAPQFHENHMFCGTLAFNLLMGRGWPARPGDLEEAEQLCRELGLGTLLDIMPGGLRQQVGDTGWQLSHGEQSRVFLARALLQEAELVVLDESFATLDPNNLGRALGTTLARAPTLVWIAHP
jgi:ATP-binding cassette subfamily B protein